MMQPPPRGCVLKQIAPYYRRFCFRQPPPRGCVLKPLVYDYTPKLPGGSRLRAAVC